MKIVSYLSRDGRAGMGALLAHGEVLDFLGGSPRVPLPARALDWFDLDGATLPAAGAFHDAVISDPGLAASCRAEGTLFSRELVRFLAPVARPGKLICIGLNYRDHAAESGMPLPEKPVCFTKFSSCVIGPGDAVRLPPGSSQTDYEAELAFVVGRRARNVPLERAYDHVLGYVALNDVSARDFQFADGQWTRGKSCDTFAPMGEFVATKDEIPDPHRLRIALRLNGATLQDSNTEQLVFGVPELLSFLSSFVTLEPGDVVATGTPPGVGFARKPPIFLRPGDIMEVDIAGLGILRNPVVEG